MGRRKTPTTDRAVYKTDAIGKALHTKESKSQARVGQHSTRNKASSAKHGTKPKKTIAKKKMAATAKGNLHEEMDDGFLDPISPHLNARNRRLTIRRLRYAGVSHLMTRFARVESH